MTTTNRTSVKVLELLRSANTEIDRLARQQPRPSHLLPKAEPGSVQYHAFALAGILNRTHAQSITLQIGAVIVEARRAS